MEKKIIFAATSSLPKLGLGTPAAAILGEWNAWTPDGTNYILRCDTHARREAHDYLAANWATPIASHLNPTAQVGAAFAGICPASLGVLATDSPWAALEKICKHAGPHFNPESL